MTETQGQRIRYLRERKGMTRVVAAGLCGRGEDWLKKIESGVRPLHNITLLARLATVLGCQDIRDIAPDDAASVTILPGQRRLYHPAADGIRAATRRRPHGDSEPPDLDALERRARDGWRRWHLSDQQRSEVGAMLPDLIRDGETAVHTYTDGQRRRAYGVLATIYHLGQQMTAHVTEPELYWTLQDRGVSAAYEADEPRALAMSAFWAACALRASEFTDEALRAIDDGLAVLEPRLPDGDDELRALAGALNLNQAVTHARRGAEADAWRHWDAADDIVQRLPEGYWHYWTAFSRGNVDVHAVTLAADLAHGHKAVTRASDLDPETVPSVERRTRLRVDTARGYLLDGEPVAALAVMEEAAHTSLESVQYTPVARETVTALVHARTAALGKRIDRLADRVGVQTG